jgi:hypothetical protein
MSRRYSGNVYFDTETSRKAIAPFFEFSDFLRNSLQDSLITIDSRHTPFESMQLIVCLNKLKQGE